MRRLCRILRFLTAKHSVHRGGIVTFADRFRADTPLERSAGTPVVWVLTAESKTYLHNWSRVY